VSEFIRSLLARPGRYRQFSRSFPKKRLGLRVLAANLEERARHETQARTSLMAERKPDVLSEQVRHRAASTGHSLVN
jgi:hypothetical protein